jgi:hypothetical protein
VPSVDECSGLSTRWVLAYSVFRTVLTEVCRFQPPEGQAADITTLADLNLEVHRVVSDAISCLAEGLDRRHWAEILAHVPRCVELADSLFDDRPVDDEPDLRFERARGLSTAAMTAGDGMTFATRVIYAWVRDREGLDERLYSQLPHLLDANVALTDKVRVHVAGMLARLHPAPTHAAAVAGRDLVTCALVASTSDCIAVIADQVGEESAMYFTHRKVVAERAEWDRSVHGEDKLRSALDMYLAVMEGDVRRTARTVLRLLGRPVERDATLGQLLEVLARESAEPMCSLLVSCANRQWRNAIAHSQIHWDPVAEDAVLGTERLEPVAIETAAMAAFDLCAGFETGVAIALNDVGNPHHQVVRMGHVGWSAHVMRVLGSLGVEANGFRRHGTAFSLHITGLTMEKFRDVLVGVFIAGIEVPGLGRT